MEKLLHEDPERRLKIEQIKAHAWFNGRKDVYNKKEKFIKKS